MSDNKHPSEQRNSEFANQADAAQAGVVQEFLLFLRHTRKWWLTPVLVLLLLDARESEASKQERIAMSGLRFLTGGSQKSPDF